jgi:hypothetical protein
LKIHKTSSGKSVTYFNAAMGIVEILEAIDRDTPQAIGT